MLTHALLDSRQPTLDDVMNASPATGGNASARRRPSPGSGKRRDKPTPPPQPALF